MASSCSISHGYGCVVPQLPCRRTHFNCPFSSQSAALSSSSPRIITNFSINVLSATLTEASLPPFAASPSRKRFSHIARLISELITAEDVPSILEPWLSTLSMDDWNVLLSEVGAKNWRNAWHAFSMLRDTSFRPGSISVEDKANEEVEGPLVYLKICTTIAKVLSRKGRKEEIVVLQQQMKEASIRPDAPFYNAIFHCYASQGLTSEISKGLLQMEGAGVKPDRLTYEALISANLHGEDAKLDRAAKILKDMLKEGLNVGSNTFKNVIKAFWKADDPDGAEEVFKVMQASGQTVDLKVIQKLMQLHGRKGDFKRNQELLQMLQDVGIRPNGAVYDYLLFAYCKAGLVEQAQKHFSNYKSVTGVKPSLVAYNMMIDACGKFGLHEMAVQVYADLCNSGLKPNVVSYCSIISTMVKAERFPKADQLYKRMVSQGIEPNMHIIMLMTHCYTKRNWTRLGHEIYNSMRDSGVPMTDTAYGTFLALYIEGHWFEHAAALLMEMESKGFKLDIPSHGLLIRSFGTLTEEKASLVSAVKGSKFEVCQLLTSLFLGDVHTEAAECSQILTPFLQKWAENHGVSTIASVFNALLDCFWEKGMSRVVSELLQRARARNMYAHHTKPQFHSKEWALDIRGLSIGGGKGAMIDWLVCSMEKSESGLLIDDIQMVVITGDGGVQTHARGLKGALLSVLAKYGSPFVESSDKKKLLASASDVFTWISESTPLDKNTIVPFLQ